MKYLFLPFRIKTYPATPNHRNLEHIRFSGVFHFRSFFLSRSQGHPSNKRRPDGDGMDSSVEDAGLEVPERHLTGDCQCACDHVVYSPTAYTCLQVSEIYWGLAPKRDNPYFVLEPAKLIVQILDETNKIVGRGMMEIYWRYGLEVAIYVSVSRLNSNSKSIPQILKEFPKLNLWKVTIIQFQRDLRKTGLTSISDRWGLGIF